MAGCKTAAKMLYTATNTLGCKPYLNAQSNACYCTSTGSSSGKNKNKQKDQTYNNKRDSRQDNKQKPNYGWKNPEDMWRDVLCLVCSLPVCVTISFVLYDKIVAEPCHVLDFLPHKRKNPLSATRWPPLTDFLF